MKFDLHCEVGSYRESHIDTKSKYMKYAINFVAGLDVNTMKEPSRFAGSIERVGTGAVDRERHRVPFEIVSCSKKLMRRCDFLIH